jgi:hypothetical protein
MVWQPWERGQGTLQSVSSFRLHWEGQWHRSWPIPFYHDVSISSPVRCVDGSFPQVDGGICTICHLLLAKVFFLETVRVAFVFNLPFTGHASTSLCVLRATHPMLRDWHTCASFCQLEVEYVEALRWFLIIPSQAVLLHYGKETTQMLRVEVPNSNNLFSALVEWPLKIQNTREREILSFLDLYLLAVANWSLN